MSIKGSKLSKVVLSVFCSVVMLVQPLIGTVNTYAAEVNVNEVVSTVDETAPTVDETAPAVDEAAPTVDETPAVEESTPTVNEENTETDEDVVSDNDVEIPSLDESTEDEENSSVSANEGPQQTEQSEPGLSMPADYVLSEAQLQDKEKLRDNLSGIVESDEGTQFTEREVVFLSQSKEEAEAISIGYHAELKSYEYGIAVLKLSEEVSTVDAVTAAADLNNNLPAVWPNYYRYASGVAVSENELSTETINENSDEEMFEIVEEKCLEENEQRILVGDEEVDLDEYNSVLQKVADPYISSDSDMYQWQHAAVGSAYAWDAGYTGAGVKVAVLDSGVTWSNGNDLQVTGEYEFLEDTNSTADIKGHGTYVAGIIGARANEDYGRGIAPDTSLYSLRVLGDDGSGSSAGIMAGIRHAITLNVDLINMSLGGTSYSGIEQTVINEAYDAGIMVIAASGNDGRNSIHYPAAYEHVISVAATDQNNNRASFSNYGATVDLAAPGVDIPSTGNDNSYQSLSGTSVACPIVTGEAAVLLSAGLPALEGKSGKDKVDALEKLLKASTISAGSDMGAGIVSLTKALAIVVTKAKPTAPIITATVATNKQSVSVAIKTLAGTKIYYSTDGKTPSFKNGLISNASVYSSALTLNKAKSYTIKAIAVNASGVSSPVKSVTVKLSPLVNTITISGVNKIAKGKSTQLKATVVPDYAVNKNVSWSISGTKESGVSVSQTGRVTAKANATPAKYTVTATAKDGSGKKGTYAVTVIENAQIKSVKAKAKKLTYTLPNDKSANLFANLVAVHVDSKKTVAASDFYWSSNNDAVAKVTSTSGALTNIKPGTATITALANDGSGKKATFSIVVKKAVTTISIKGADAGKLAVGKSVKLKAVVDEDASDQNVKWSVTPAGTGVTVANGIVKATAKATTGAYTVKAEANGKSATKKITVQSDAITKFVLDKNTAKIFRTAGSTSAPTSTTITATVAGLSSTSNMPYEVTSSNPGIATSSAAATGGKVKITVKATGNASGSTTITIVSTDGSNKKATCKVTVANPVAKISVEPKTGASSYVAQGKGLQLIATLNADYGALSTEKVNWTIASAQGLKISKNGRVTATGKTPIGGYQVRATAADGSGATTTYNIVVNTPITRLRVSGMRLPPYWLNVAMLGDTYTLPVEMTGATYLTPVSVTSSNESVCSASIVTKSVNNGSVACVKLVAKKCGRSTITVKALDGTNKRVSYNVKVE